MDKVRDHCHVTGKFRGAAHNKCNINLRLPRKLSIIFHNLQGYDDHIIFKELNNFIVDIAVIPKGIKKYMSIIVNRHITFIDVSLPEKKYFYSSLKDGKQDGSDGNISDEQYFHLKNVWKIFNFKTFEDCHNHYLKKDYY